MKDIDYLNIKGFHLKFAAERGSEKTYCSSEVARALFPKNWRSRMNDVRVVADNLYDDKKLIVSQFKKNLNIKLSKVKGHIRIQKRPNLKL